MCACGGATQLCSTHAFTWTINMCSHGVYILCTPVRHINQVLEAGCEALFHGALPGNMLVFYMRVPSRKRVFVCDQSSKIATRC